MIVDCLSQRSENGNLEFNNIISYLKMYISDHEMVDTIEIIKELNYKFNKYLKDNEKKS